MLTEDMVVDAVVEHLQQAGWSIDSSARATEHGDDIVASRDGGVLVVEAKGEGSSKEGTRRYGQPFTWGQVGTHVAVAVARCLAVVSADPQRLAALAVPDNDHHRRRVQAIEPALTRLGIAVFWVSGPNTVRLSGSS